MNLKRLAEIEAHFRNPPSASCNTELALEVIAELRPFVLAAEPKAALHAELDAMGAKLDLGVKDALTHDAHPEHDAIAEAKEHAAAIDLADHLAAAPTPPHSPKAHGKKGHK